MVCRFRVVSLAEFPVLRGVEARVDMRKGEEYAAAVL
jgi:hypothetical protein